MYLSRASFSGPFSSLGVNRNTGQIVEGVGPLPLIPLAIGATALLGGGAAAGYALGRPEYDQFGNPIPGPVDRLAQSAGNALVLATVVGVGYLIWSKETKRKRRR